jgi:hypothetical protein
MVMLSALGAGRDLRRRKIPGSQCKEKTNSIPTSSLGFLSQHNKDIARKQKRYIRVVTRQTQRGKLYAYFSSGLKYIRTRGSVVVETLCYRREGRGFETR